MNDAPRSGDEAVVIDPQNPWLGLFSYSEESSAWFHGRDEEAAELCRRIQRKLLSVLFGQSGLGKTSLLRAGVVPRLRAEGFCPVYVRIDYAPESPPPSEQIKQAIFKASAAVGAWTRPGSAVAGESLWEFLHHRGDLLRDAAGHTLLPLLIFDQFEEIFTLGQADDAGRQRARQFLEDLADLIENRPPATLEARIEDDDAAAEDFDFARADYRVLIALREDYLAHLEGVKTIMPSITQNRMRLARMTGAQALTAVRKPGGKLVSQEIAEAIVRFVAGGSELGNAEVEPSLLSLVCRELNSVRQAQKKAEISADLLAGSRDTILSEFYERALADQPAGVRRVVEDLLLTESGYRESVGEERVRKALAAADAPADALPILVNRRLLRIEERLDMRRVELTHDVLCSVVLASRNARQEREAREAAEQALAQQREREAATRRALVRARQIAGVCAVLMLVAVAGAVFGWVNLERARTAEALAQKSRGDAEQLVGFLIDDLYAELAPTGRLETLGRLAHMAVAYYDNLPPALVTARTRTYRALAQAREGEALLGSGQSDAAYKLFDTAQATFERLRAQGDRSEPVAFGLGLVFSTQGSGLFGSGRGTDKQLRQAVEVLRPYVYAPEPTRRVRQLYADTLNFLSHSQPLEQAVATCEEARKILAGLGATDLSDLDAAASYADTTDSQARFLLTLGKIDQARSLERKVFDLAENVLARRPGDLHSLANRFYAAELLSAIARRQHDDASALDFAQRAERASADEVRFSPSELGAWQRWSLALGALAQVHLDQGDVSLALATSQRTIALESDPRHPPKLAQVLMNAWAFHAGLQARTGDVAGAAASLQAHVRSVAAFVAQLAPDDPRRTLMAMPRKSLNSWLLLAAGEPEAALRDANAVIANAAAVRIPEHDVVSTQFRQKILDSTLRAATMAALQLDRFPQAQALAAQRLAQPDDRASETDPYWNRAISTTLLAHALAGQGQREAARAALQPALAWFAQQARAGAHDTGFRHDYAYALYVDAIAQPEGPAGTIRHDAELKEASEQIQGATDQARQMSDLRRVAGLIAAARAK